jgi:HNH endonuclease
MPKVIELTGRTFGRWIVLRRTEPRGKRRAIWWLCKCACGTVKAVPSTPLRDGRSQSCGCRKLDILRSETGSRNRAWKGGRITDDNGYVQIYLPGHHRAKKTGYVREHLVVMEKALGRQLLADETVHHKNGNRSDNRPANLELWSSSHPPGQRATDLVKWAKEIINRYA